MILSIILACLAMAGVGVLFGYILWDADQEVQWKRFGEEEALIIWIKNATP